MILAVLFWSALSAALTPESHAATIIHSNDVLGEIEPCGCRTNPMGGYARKANFLKGLKDRETLQLDSGDLLFASNSVPEFLKQQNLVQARWAVKILGQLHHDAVTPGEKDFALGVAAFKKLIKDSPVRFLAANLLDASGKPLLSPSAVFVRKRADGTPVRIAVLGLVGKEIPWPTGLKASDPIAAAKDAVPALRIKADYVVALTHEGLDADKKLAAEVPGIDIIIGGHTQSFLQTPLKVGSTTLYQSSFRNQYIGAIDLDTFPTEDSYRMTGLDAGYESPSELPSPVDDSVRKFKAAIAELNSKELPMAAVPAGHAKFQTVPRCAECHLKQFDFWRKTPHANALAPLVKAGQDKNKECLQCHTVGLGDPRGFSHVNQMAELETGSRTRTFLSNERFADYLASVHDGGSLKSPVRGLDSTLTEGAPPLTIHSSLSKFKQAWAPVQCENCHGPGENHPMSGHYAKTVEMQVCLSCHTPARAPEWYKEGQPDWEKIKAKHHRMACPSGDMTLPD